MQLYISRLLVSAILFATFCNSFAQTVKGPDVKSISKHSVPASKPTVVPPTNNSAQGDSKANSVMPNQAVSNPPNTRLWNLQDVDILSVINEISKETGKNFIIDPRVNGKVTIVSSHPMGADEIYQVFLAVLQIHGFSAVPSGNVIKIVPDLDAKQLNTVIADKANPGSGDELVVRVVPVKNVAAEQLVPMLRPMLPQWADVAAYSPTNILILSGRAASLERLVNIIQRVDTSNTSGVEMIRLRYASAADLANELSSLQQADKNISNGALVSIAADERSNSILLNGSEFGRAKLRSLILKLDRSSPEAVNNTQVISLHYLNAKSLVTILNGIVQNTPGTSSSGTDKGGAATPSAGVSASVGSGNKRVAIQAEPSTNSIIISAPPAIMQNLKSVIASLDVRPAQVLVEAVIVQVSENKMQQLGIQWGTNGGTVDQNGNIVSTSDTFSSITGGLGVGIINRGSMKALINALANDQSTNILSTPSLVVLDNQKATFKIGQQISTTTGSYPMTNNGATALPFTTTSYKDVDLHLIVKPQINRGDAVQLQIAQGDSSPTSTIGSAGNPNINSSSIQTSVLINSGQILVLGGLISKDLEETDQKIPILGDIPILGRLFHSKSHNYVNKNLMVFLRPTILHDATDGAQPTNSRYNFMWAKEQQKRTEQSYGIAQEARPVAPGLTNPQLPEPFSNAN